MLKIEEQIEEIWSQVTTDEQFSRMISDILKELVAFKGANQEREEAKLECDIKQDEISELTSIIQQKLNQYAQL